MILPRLTLEKSKRSSEKMVDVAKAGMAYSVIEANGQLIHKSLT